MEPLRAAGGGKRTIVRGFSLGFSPLGRAVGKKLVEAATTIELTCVLITKIRLDERTAAEPLATLTGTLTSDGSGAEFSLQGDIVQDASLEETVEQDGHRRPRRKLVIQLEDGSEQALLLPDTMQVPSGFMEVMAKLTVDGEVHGDVDQNEILDVPLLPLRLTHAIFHFVDSSNEPLAELSAEFEDSNGEKLEATTDDFGEVYLDASAGQSYTLSQILPAEDDKVAIVETNVSGDEVQAVA